MKVPISISFDYEVYNGLQELVSKNKLELRSVSNYVNVLCMKALKESMEQNTKQSSTKKKGS